MVIVEVKILHIISCIKTTDELMHFGNSKKIILL